MSDAVQSARSTAAVSMPFLDPRQDLHYQLVQRRIGIGALRHVLAHSYRCLSFPIGPVRAYPCLMHI